MFTIQINPLYRINNFKVVEPYPSILKMSKYASISIIIVIRIESRIKVYNIRNNSKHTPLALWIQGVAVVLRRIDCNLAVILSRSVLSVRVLVVTFVALRRSVTVIKQRGRERRDTETRNKNETDGGKESKSKTVRKQPFLLTRLKM